MMNQGTEPKDSGPSGFTPEGPGLVAAAAATTDAFLGAALPFHAGGTPFGRSPEMTEARAIAFCRDLKFPSERESSELKETAHKLAAFYDSGYGDYIALALLLIRMQPHARQEYLLEWQRERSAILSAQSGVGAPPDSAADKTTPAALEQIRAAADSAACQRLAERLALEALVSRSTALRHCLSFLGQSGRSVVNCDDLTSILLALCFELGRPHYPEIACLSHLCQYDPPTGVVLDNNAKIITKNELVARYPSGYWLTAEQYALTRLNADHSVCDTVEYTPPIRKGPTRFSLVVNLYATANREQSQRPEFAQAVGGVIDLLVNRRAYRDFFAGYWLAGDRTRLKREQGIELLQSPLEEALLRDPALLALGRTTLGLDEPPWQRSIGYLKQVVPRMRHAGPALKSLREMCKSRNATWQFLRQVGLT
jgi:hypothetical protein